MITRMQSAATYKFKVWGILWDYRLSHSCSLLCWHALITLTIVPYVLNNCFACIFRNASKGTISQAISTQPSITTASPVWWPGCQPATANKRLNSIQKLASLWIIWAMQTAVCAMEALTCLPTIDMVVQSMVCCTMTVESGVLVLPHPQSS
jgi:hypothetical protein